MDRIPTKIKLKVHALFTYIFDVLKVLLRKIWKIQPPDLLLLWCYCTFLTPLFLLMIHHEEIRLNNANHNPNPKGDAKCNSAIVLLDFTSADIIFHKFLL